MNYIKLCQYAFISAAVLPQELCIELELGGSICGAGCFVRQKSELWSHCDVSMRQLCSDQEIIGMDPNSTKQMWSDAQST